MKQLPNQLIITFPNAYHEGFNMDPNLAEAVNFATKFQKDYGLQYMNYACGNHESLVELGQYFKTYRSDGYTQWSKCRNAESEESDSDFDYQSIGQNPAIEDGWN